MKGYISSDDLLDRIAELREGGIPFVVATVIGTRGATPRKIGAKMLVAADGRLFGTVGGGMVEARVVERARQLLEDPTVERFEWDLASFEAGGMVCGGRMEFLLEPFMVQPQAFVFGAGHVGEALCQVLRRVGFALTVVDDREELLTDERLPSARLVAGNPPELAESLDIPRSGFCLIVNRTHSYDQEVLRALLRRDPLPRYIGLMASRKKRREVFEALRAEGISEDRLKEVHCPVGLPIGAETPAELAISIAAEMIAVLRGASGGNQ